MRLSEEQKLNLSSNLASFRKSTTFQAGVCSIIANLQTKAEDLSELREMFTRLDKNNDGFLSQEELESGMAEIAQIFHLAEPDVRDWIRAADQNGDGQLDYTEFIAAAYQKDRLLSKKNLLYLTLFQQTLITRNHPKDLRVQPHELRKSQKGVPQLFLKQELQS